MANYYPSVAVFIEKLSDCHCASQTDRNMSSHWVTAAVNELSIHNAFKLWFLSKKEEGKHYI